MFSALYALFKDFDEYPNDFSTLSGRPWKSTDPNPLLHASTVLGL